MRSWPHGGSTPVEEEWPFTLAAPREERVLHDNREVVDFGQQISRHALDHGQDLTGRGDRYGGVGPAAIGDGQISECEAACEVDQIGSVLEIGQQVCGSDGRLGVI